MELYNPFDDGAKRLIALCTQDLISWLHKTAVFKEHGTKEFKRLTFEADAIQLCTINKVPAIIHLEIQSEGTRTWNSGYWNTIRLRIVTIAIQFSRM